MQFSEQKKEMLGSWLREFFPEFLLQSHDALPGQLLPNDLHISGLLKLQTISEKPDK